VRARFLSETPLLPIASSEPSTMRRDYGTLASGSMMRSALVIPSSLSRDALTGERPDGGTTKVDAGITGASIKLRNSLQRILGSQITYCGASLNNDAMIFGMKVTQSFDQQ
jgi:hypothetical protein